jgi:hypothetical protein
MIRSLVSKHDCPISPPPPKKKRKRKFLQKLLDMVGGVVG